MPQTYVLKKEKENMQAYKKRVLYAKIWKAREHCAGSDVRDHETVEKEILDAKDYAEQFKAGDIIIGKLMKALEIMRTANNYYQRLPADDILCDILNHDLEG